MKKIIYVILSLLIFIQCASLKKTSIKSSKQLDVRLFGSWKGSEQRQLIEGVQSSWIQHRFEDGKFLLLASYIDNGDIIQDAEKGEWWIEDGLFYELHYFSNKTDVYEFEVLDNNHIKFKSKSMAYETNTETYEFIDIRIEE